MQKIKKRISLLLILFLLVQIIPTNINAKENDNNQSNEKKTEESSKVNKKKTGKITKEITEERTENSKRFQKDDGSFEVAQYVDKIHYLEDGKLLDIDNSLIESKDKDGNTYLENKENEFKVKISKDVTSKKLVELEKDKYNISWNIDKVNKSEGTIANVDENKLKDEIEKSVDYKVNNDKEISLQSATDKEETKNIMVENEEIKTLEKVNSNVNFTNVFENTDLEYVINGSQVKENLILNKKSDNVSYNFNINVKNLNPVLQVDKSIIFYDSEDKGKEVFKIESPIMYDKSGEASDKINVSLNQTKDGYTLGITPDKEWLNSSDRVYPITIDPSMRTSPEVKYIHDTFVASNDPDPNKDTNMYVRVGQTPSVGRTRTYIKFDLPALSTGSMITNAELNLQFNASESSVSRDPINVHNVTGAYDINTVLWANQPIVDTKVEAIGVINPQYTEWVSWDITSIAKQWFSTTDNNGLMMESDNYMGHSAFWSSNMHDAYSKERPFVSFDYINNSGLEDYWTYHSQSVGRAGTSYQNDYNGNLIFIHNDFAINGNIMPISINHVYNSNDRYNADNLYGFGWRLNLSQKVVWELINGKGHYTYIDEDGTKHYFEDKPGTEMSDELNLGLKLKIETYDKSYTITDKKSNKLNFHPGVGDLNYIKDANGNTMNFGYSTASSGNGVRILTKIADGAGRFIDIGYTPVGGLDTIKDMEGRITKYNYDGIGKLTSITYPDGKISQYSYDANRNLKSVINHDGYKISYDYYPIAPYRIKNISESNINGTLGGNLGISYGYNSTTFTDVKGRKDTYQFNDIGKTVCIKDSYGNAEYYQYGDTTNATKLTNKSKLQKTIVNLLTNHDLETNDIWETGSDAGAGTGGFSTETSYLGSRSLKLSKSNNVSRQYANQWVTLEKGKTYTFSAYVKTVNISNTNNNVQGATIDSYYDPTTGPSSELIYKCSKSKVVNGTTDWQRLESTFTIPMDAASARVCIILNLEKETGTAYFDSMQLEEGSIANRYNLLDNGHLSAERAVGGIPSKWGTSGTSGPGSLVSVNDSDHPSNLDSSAYGVSGVYGVEKRLGQSAYVSGKAGDIYSIGGWGKGYSVPSGTFAIQAAIITPNGVQWESFPFNEDSNDWQYISGRFITKSDYLRIDVYFLYKDNANTAYFDGAQLYKEEFGQSYQYDSKGNIASTASIAKQNSDFQYNSKNDLIQAVDPKGSSFNYTYDDKHNLKTAISSENVNYSFDYHDNGYGNIKSVQIGNSTKYIKSSATYTANGNYLDTIKDSSGKTVKYVYNQAKGILNNVTDANQNTTNYEYDNRDRLKTVWKEVNKIDNKLGTGQKIINSYAYINDRIDKITHNGFYYKFGYDSLGNTTKVDVGTQNLITNTYEPRTSLLLSSKYGNGHVVSNTYDDLDRIKSKNLGGNIFDYEYDASGNLGYKKDSVNGVNYRYTYDTSNRLVSTKESNGNSLNYQYDLNNNISSVLDKVNDKGYITNYGYDKDNRQAEISYNRSNSDMETFTLNGSGYGTKGTNQITSSITTGISATATINNVTSEGYDVVVTVSSAQGGVKQVSAPTWTTINGQDDLIGIAATSVSGDTYTYRINRSEHKGEYGEYNTHVYVYDKVGNSKCIPLATKLISTPLAVTAVIKDEDSNGYNVVATVTSAPSGVNRVAFPTWTTNNGQDDTANPWPTATRVSGNTYTYHVNRSEHKSEFGEYNTHVYLYDNLGNAKAVVLKTTLASKNLSVSARIANVTSTGYDVIADVTPGSAPISRVNFPTWTTCIGQDDVANPWPAATSVSGNTYTYHVNRSEHKGEFGDYNTHVYVYDQSGKSTVKVLNTTLYASVNGIDMAKDINEAKESSKTVMSANGLTQALYNLGLSKNAGTMSTMVKPDTIGKMRFILASQGRADEGLYLYIGSDDKLKVAVRNNAGNMVDVVTSTNKINEKQWYFTAINWKLDNIGKLIITMCLDSETITGSTTDFKDFSGANTSLGASVTGNLSLKGMMEQFAYNSKTMITAEMQNINKEANNTTINYKYDSLGRLENQVTNTDLVTNKVTNINIPTHKVIYSYEDGVDGVGSTTTKIKTLDNNGKKLDYAYDANGNIKTVKENGKTITYTYNELNELTREDNEVLNKTMVYKYDAGGNITSKVQYPHTTGALGTPSTPTPINYEYDATWKDKLTSYNGKPIEYPVTGDIGNPIKYNNYSFTWEAGRQLKGISGNGKTISYKYNDSGIRTQKTVNGVTTNYHLEGDKVTFESNGTDKMYYTYDSSGNLVSMNLNGVEYYYIRNAQSDIIGLFNKAGEQVVSYVYDSWGKLESTTGTLASTVGIKNPYRYKGYRYDTEIGLYYLQSRYYLAEWGRFINADGIVGTPGDLLSCNMFAYCKNNPINLMDIDGRNPFAAILVWGAAAVEAAVYAVVTYVAAVATHLLVTAVMDAINSQSSDAPSSDSGGAIGTSPSSPVDTPSDNSDTSSSAKTKTRTKKGELKRAKLPVKGKIRFVPSTNWRPTQPIPRIREGLVDRFGNVWKKGPSRTAGEAFEWDVQLSRIGQSQLGRFSRDGSHINVSLEGRITHR